ncbi:charged multivesicular body protein 7 [Tetranychus urticae]|uniref:charged multivesicular body protein 7 n=1 Tax=Tetranychus urticae TaxID=32264 RepID=UPI00077BC6F5|nr:charged multivesicular body protein 7 [Tetranychus urticae]
MPNTDKGSPPLSLTRIRHLYSKFRNRASNPEGFDSKLNYWIGAINEWSVKEKRYQFNLVEISKAFKRDNLIPDLECLRLVASELKRRNNLVSRDYFINNVCADNGSNSSWLSWGLGSLSKPLKFGLSWFNNQGDEQEECEIIDPDITNSLALVNVDAVTSGAKELMTLLTEHQYIDKCLKYEEFERLILTNFEIEPDQLDVLLLYLIANKQAVTMEDKGTKYIKFGDNIQFSDMDISLRRLESARDLIEDDIIKVEIEIEKALEEAKAAVKSSNRIKAKALLRKKKRLEDVLSKKEAQLDNIHCLSEKLVDVQSNKAVVHAYREVADVLKSAQLKHEEINDTISSIEDVFENQNDVLSDLGRSMATTIIDDDELEAELKAFMAEDEDIEVPKVPDRSPKVTDDKLEDLYTRLENLRRPITDDDELMEGSSRKSIKRKAN